MNCPRCKTTIGPLESPDAIVTCPGCGTRLMTRSAALRSQGGANPAAASATVAAPLPPASALSPPPPAAATSSGEATSAVRIGVRQTTIGGKSTGASVRTGGRRAKDHGVTLETILAEIQAVRESQQLILEALASLQRQRPVSSTGAGAVGPDDSTGGTLSPIRATARKTAILVDDTAQTREAATEELERADIPVRAFADCNKALAAIAQEKPDVIVLELGVGGELPGKDLVNMIKATMEWVDIPIVLYTRENVSNQREARQIHGADEVVAKSAGPAAMVARVISLFRR
jgi:CheY-like chemotaxis protein/predicted RNA-binding Zn-ribbon protein involved in translation (DUF1610 family)